MTIHSPLVSEEPVYEQPDKTFWSFIHTQPILSFTVKDEHSEGIQGKMMIDHCLIQKL